MTNPANFRMSGAVDLGGLRQPVPPVSAPSGPPNGADECTIEYTSTSRFLMRTPSSSMARA